MDYVPKLIVLGMYHGRTVFVVIDFTDIVLCINEYQLEESCQVQLAIRVSAHLFELIYLCNDLSS